MTHIAARLPGTSDLPQHWRARCASRKPDPDVDALVEEIVSSFLAAMALIVAPILALAIEAVVARAWHLRPYSYANDYVNFLGTRFVGEFEGYVISSPLWFLMASAWVVTGVLIAVSSLWLSSKLHRWGKILVIAFALLQAVGLVLFATVPLDPNTVAAGLLPVYLTGAFLSIIAGNALAIAVSVQWRQAELPRIVGIAGLALGAIGLMNIPATYGWLAIGIAERTSMYTFLAWSLITGSAVLRAYFAQATSTARSGLV